MKVGGTRKKRRRACEGWRDKRKKGEKERGKLIRREVVPSADG